MAPALTAGATATEPQYIRVPDSAGLNLLWGILPPSLGVLQKCPPQGNFWVSATSGGSLRGLDAL